MLIRYYLFPVKHVLVHHNDVDWEHDLVIGFDLYLMFTRELKVLPQWYLVRNSDIAVFHKFLVVSVLICCKIYKLKVKNFHTSLNQLLIFCSQFKLTASIQRTHTLQETVAEFNKSGPSLTASQLNVLGKVMYFQINNTHNFNLSYNLKFRQY